MRKEARERNIPKFAVAATGAAEDGGIPTIHMASSDDQPPKRTIRGQRRRPGSDRPSSGRADAPTRDDRPSGGGGSYPPTSGGGMSGIPGGMRGAAGGGGMLLALCALIAYMMFGGGGDGQDPFNTGGGIGPSQNQEEFDLGSGLDNPTRPPSQPLPTVNAPATREASFAGGNSAITGASGAAASSLSAASASSATP